MHGGWGGCHPTWRRNTGQGHCVALRSAADGLPPCCRAGRSIVPPGVGVGHVAAAPLVECDSTGWRIFSWCHDVDHSHQMGARVTGFPFEQLDFLYVPSSDVAADARYFTEVLGGRLVFAVEAMRTRVAAVDLTDGPRLCCSQITSRGSARSSSTGWGSCEPASTRSRAAGGSGSTRLRSRTARAARFGRRGAIGSPCIS